MSSPTFESLLEQYQQRGTRIDALEKELLWRRENEARLREALEFLVDRAANVYGESPNVDFILKARAALSIESLGGPSALEGNHKLDTNSGEP